MRTKLFANKPNNIEFTLQITMTLEKWRALQATLTSTWPAWELSSKITQMVMQAEEAFEPFPEDEASPPLTPQHGE